MSILRGITWRVNLGTIRFDIWWFWKDFHVGVCQYSHLAGYFSKCPPFYSRIIWTQLVPSSGDWGQFIFWRTYNTFLGPQSVFSVPSSIFNCLLFLFDDSLVGLLILIRWNSLPLNIFLILWKRGLYFFIFMLLLVFSLWKYWISRSKDGGRKTRGIIRHVLKI